MTLELLFALAGFAFAMSISPGPGNFLLLASGVNHGFRSTIPAVLGISAGFLAMVLAVGLGVGRFLQSHEGINTGLKLACAAYVLWLAWKIARITSFGPNNGEAGAASIGFVQAGLLQWLNPKAWAVALIVTVSYTVPSDYVASLIALIAVFALVNLPAISMWALGGVALRRVLDDPRKVRAFNIAMALLLIGSMLPVLLGVRF
jgi:threonine/homoserine/homoserine lactone efflux protein